MIHSAYLTLIDRCLRDVTQVNRPFGGKVLVCGGDFRQTTPIVKHGTRASTVAASVKTNPLWAAAEVMALTRPMRDGGDMPWSNALNDIGDGTAEHVDMTMGLPLPDQDRRRAQGGAHCILLPSGVRVFTDPEEARRWVHGDDELRDAHHAEVASNRGMLAAHNDVVTEHNERFLERLPGEIHHLYATEELDVDPAATEPIVVTEEYLARAHQPGVPDHHIALKITALIMVLRNLSPLDGLLNGTRIRVLQVTQRLIVATTLGPHARRVFIPRIRFDINLPGAAVGIVRHQFPVRLAYANTINKAQGKTLGRVCVDLRQDVFGHGQLYVACGRVTRRADVAFLVTPERCNKGFDGDRVVAINVVYPELLQPLRIVPAPRVVPAPLPDVPVAPEVEEARAALDRWLDEGGVRAAEGGEEEDEEDGDDGAVGSDSDGDEDNDDDAQLPDELLEHRE